MSMTNIDSFKINFSDAFIHPSTKLWKKSPIIFFELTISKYKRKKIFSSYFSALVRNFLFYSLFGLRYRLYFMYIYVFYYIRIFFLHLFYFAFHDTHEARYSNLFAFIQCFERFIFSNENTSIVQIHTW